MTPLARTLEALLFLSPEPVPAAALAEAADCPPEELADRARGARAPRTRPASAASSCASSRAAGRSPPRPSRRRPRAACSREPRTPPLTPAQAETLAIVAYLQPVSRPEITRIRGVAADSASGTLLERGLIEESGRSQFGAVLYRTTPLFLKLFGLNALADLPDPRAVGSRRPRRRAELRDRLLRAGDMRSGRQGAPEQPGLGDGEPGAGRRAAWSDRATASLRGPAVERPSTWPAAAATPHGDRRVPTGSH